MSRRDKRLVARKFTSGRWMQTRVCIAFFFFSLAFNASAWAQYTLIPMDETQTDHLRAYGVAYWALQEPRQFVVEWLLNYRGGSWMIQEDNLTLRHALLLGVRAEKVDHAGYGAIQKGLASGNMETVRLEKAPRVAVYTPPTAQPWDDAVTLAMEYAQIPYDKVWDPGVLHGKLSQYDWLHLHHEDFTAQYGKFWERFRTAPWYQEQVAALTNAAQKAGYASAQAFRLAVAQTIRAYVEQGGFLFAMCAATDTIDIALAANGLDIIAPEIDGTPVTPGFQEQLDFSKTFAFENFKVISNPMVYEFSDIDCGPSENRPALYQSPHFTLFEFSARKDPVPAMLTQCHTRKVKEFRGQTSTFKKDLVKKSVALLGEFPGENSVKYLHGNRGQGTFTFLGGHDPEDYEHLVGESATDLALHKNSPGYRLILNNVLFPAAKKRHRRT